MKIISKYKDYYDFYQGIYGIDEKIVLDRRDSEFNLKQHMFSNFDRIRFYVCENVLDCVFYDGKFHYAEEINIIDNIYNKYNQKLKYYYNKYYYNKDHLGSETCVFNNMRFIKSAVNISKLIETGYNKSQNINEVLDCPIVIRINDKYNNGDIIGNPSIFKYPKLSDFNFGSVIGPHDLFVMIQNWLSKQIDKKQQIIDNQTDEQKIINKGFDNKRSFRPKMK